ncbi:MAG TPA: phosphatidylglycerol lysyltransferase domain-containing protein [Acetobacteraceae bacterium]|nr:phosphatidylglycerol lysyltransferase domain-containing protein [Acetobacteraceae bacterium]
MSEQTAPRFSAWKRHAATAFGVLLLVGALYVIQREFRNLSWRDIRDALHATSGTALLIAAGWTVVTYAVLSAYDRLGSIYAGHPVSWARSAFASFTAYALANNLGFATVSGAAVRYRFYASWGLPAVAIAKIVAFTSLTFGLGGFTLIGLVLIVEPEMLGHLTGALPHWAIQAIGVVLWAAVAAYVVLSRFIPHFTLFGHRVDLPGMRMAVAQTALASADVAVTGLIFYTLLPPTEGLTFLHFLGIYVVAFTAGLAANVPGGIGVFDGAMMLGLSAFLPAPQVVGALLLFRLYYYIIPLFVAGALFAAFELGQRRNLIPAFEPEQRVAMTFEVPVLSGLTSLAAVTLIFIGALPPKASMLEGFLEILDEAGSHFAASVVGSLLLAAAYGLVRRLSIAWWFALLLMLNGAFIAWIRGEAWWLTGAFLLVALLLSISKSSFYRRARITAEAISFESAVALGAGAICALTLATVAYGGRVSDQSWWEVVLRADAPASLRFAVGAAGVLLLAAALRLLRPARPLILPWSPDIRARLAIWGARVPDEADGAIMGAAGTAGVAFIRRDRVWLAIGDPAGEAQDRISAIWRFRDACERAGVDPAFYDVGPELLRVYEDIGLTAFPISAGDMSGERYLVCRAERDLEALLPLLPTRARVG